jgi:nucleoside-diphosphate-sugar epimerase
LSLYVCGDILDKETLRRSVREAAPDCIVHLAARCDLAGSTLEEYRANTVGVQNVIDVIKDLDDITRVIFSSSRYVHSNECQPRREDEYSPFTIYGASKAEGERIVRASGLSTPWLIVRPTSIWGPWFGVPYKSFFEAVRRGRYVHPRGELLYKSYGFVGNVAHQLWALLDAPIDKVRGRVFYAADYVPIEVRAMAESIRRHFGSPPIRAVPLSLMKALAIAGDSLKRIGWNNAPLTSFRLRNLRAQMVYDISATEDIAGPLPYSLEQGVEETVRWMKTHG